MGSEAMGGASGANRKAWCPVLFAPKLAERERNLQLSSSDIPLNTFSSFTSILSSVIYLSSAKRKLTSLQRCNFTTVTSCVTGLMRGFYWFSRMKVSCSICLEKCDTRRGRYCPKCGTVLPPRTDTGLRVEDECCKYDVLSALLFMHLCVNPKQSLSLLFSVTVVWLRSQHLYKPWAVNFVTTPLLPVIYLSAVRTDRASSQ